MTWRIAGTVLLILMVGARIVAAQDEAATPAAAEVVLVEQRDVEIRDARIISLSPDGASLVAARPAAGYQRGQLCTYDVATLTERACADLAGLDSGLRIADVVWSPDSSRIAFAEEAFKLLNDGDIWVMDAATGQVTDLTDEGIRERLPILDPSNSDVGEFFLDVSPAWSPDGQSLAFSRTIWREGEWRGNEIAVIAASGGEVRSLLQVTTEAGGVVYFGMRWQPDGTRLFYSVLHSDREHPDNGIWVVDADGQNARKVTGEVDPELGALAVVQVAAGGDRLLGFYPIAAGSYSSRGPIYALVDVATGQTTPLTVGDPSAPEYAYVSVATLSPDGSHLLYVARLTDPDHQVFVRELASGTETRVIDGLPRAFTVEFGLVPTWATDGSVFFNTDITKGIVFRLEGGNAPPPATPSAEPVASPVPSVAAVTLREQRAIEIPDTRIVSLSPDGRLVAAVKPPVGRENRLCVYDVETLAEEACGDLSGLDSGLRLEDIVWSPDGAYLAFGENAFLNVVDGDLWLMESATGTLTNLDDDGYSGRLPLFGDDVPEQPITVSVSPVFSPDSRTVAFSRSTLSNGEWTGNEIAVAPIDGGTPETLTRVTLDSPAVVYFGIRWAPDASRLYYSVQFPTASEPRNGIWTVDADGLNQRQLLGKTNPDLGSPAVLQVSARGDRLLAYYPLAAAQFGLSGDPLYAMVDTATGVATPLTVPDSNAPPEAGVTLATFSPDGSQILLLVWWAENDFRVFVRDVASGAAIRLGESMAMAGPSVWGVPPTWAGDGTVLIPGGPAFSTATIFRIEGASAPPAVATPEPTPSPATTPATTGAIGPGTTAIVNDEGVRMRAAPSRDAPAVLELERGAEVTVIGEAVEVDGLVWWPVEDPTTRTIGWVRAEFLSPPG